MEIPKTRKELYNRINDLKIDIKDLEWQIETKTNELRMLKEMVENTNVQSSN